MRIRYLIVLQAGLLACLNPLHAEAITLEEVMKMASEQHPRLQMAEQDVKAAKGELTEQSAYAYNPELTLEPQRRRLSGGGTSNDYYITLSQGIEIGGKRRFRELSAQAALTEANQQRVAMRQQLIIGAARAFVELFFAKEILDLRTQQVVMFKRLSQAIDKKLEMGESNQLEANLARSSYISALSALSAAKQALTVSLAHYYAAIGRPGERQQVKPELPKLLLDWKPPEGALKIALESRPDLAALREKLEKSRSKAGLARAQRIPDPTISFMNGREAGEQLIQLGISFPIPVWNSHKGAYKAALAESTRTQAELKWAEHRLRLQVQAALNNHTDAMHSLVATYKAEDQQSAFDNIKLAQTAFEAGELDLEQLVIHVNQGLDARLTALDLMRQGWLARIHLAEVLGRPEYLLKGSEQ